MSNYTTWIKHPVTGESVQANFLDDYFGVHEYGVVIVGSSENDPVYRAEDVEVDHEKIKEEENLIEELAQTLASAERETNEENVEEFYQHMLKSTPILNKSERASLKLKIVDILALKDKQCEEKVRRAVKAERERIIEGMKIGGEMGKLTPFQQTVNTYIKNRGEELTQSITNNK